MFIPRSGGNYRLTRTAAGTEVDDIATKRYKNKRLRRLNKLQTHEGSISMQSKNSTNDRPLASLDEWEDDLLRRYPEPTTDSAASFRNYAAEARPSVKEFYRLNHQFQTLDFVKSKREQYLGLTRRRMSIWDTMEYLNTLVDDSDPDIDLPQIEHLLQTAEAIRKAGRPRWYILTGLIHDLGKILCLWDEPQWADRKSVV